MLKLNINGEEKIQGGLSASFAFLKELNIQFVVSDEDYLFMKKFVEEAAIDRWKKILEIKELFEKQIGCSIYTLLPGVVGNSFC